MDNLLTQLQTCSELEQSTISQLREYCSYGSNGMINHTVDCLELLRDRIARGDMIGYYNKPLTMEDLHNIVDNVFTTCVADALRKSSKPEHNWEGTG